MGKIKPEPRIFLAAALLLIIWYFGQRYFRALISEPDQKPALSPARVLLDPSSTSH